MKSVSPLFEDPASPGVHDEDKHPVVPGPPGDQIDGSSVDGLSEPGVEVISRAAGGDGRQDLRQRQEPTVAHRISGPVLAVIVSALFYAALHFIGTRWTTDPDQIGWDTGIRIAIDGFSHLREAAPDNFLGLFMAGLFLGTLRVLKPDRLVLCMGIHAGWVFVIKTAKPLTTLNLQSSRWNWVGNYDYIIGYFSSAWLTLITLVLVLVMVWPTYKSRIPYPS